MNQMLKDCNQKHKSKDSKYATLMDAISKQVWNAVGKTHWTQAKQIQKQQALIQKGGKWKNMIA